MYSQSDIQSAVEGGALTAEQAASLRNYTAGKTGVPTGDAEYVRIMLGFSDVYVFYASLFLFLGLGWLGYKITESATSPLTPLLIVAAAWGLAEYYSRRARLALPGITYSICVAYGILVAVMFAAITIIGADNMTGETPKLVAAAGCLLGAGAAYLYWKRFHEPIAVSSSVGLVIFALMSLLGTIAPADADGTVPNLVLLVLGLLTGVYAMFWDARDTARVTARADTGFWLHWLAAWLTIVSLAALLHLPQGVVSAGTSITTIILFLVFAVIGLIVSRRTWVLAAAYPLGVGLYHLLRPAPEPTGFDDMGGYGNPYANPFAPSTDSLMITFLIIGVLLLLLGIFWTPLRKGLVGMLPAGLQAKLPGTNTVPEVKAFD